MKFTETPVTGAYVIDVNRIGDSRGFFGRLWCEKELLDQGLVPHIRQSNIGFSPQKGTLRGLHYQKPPHQEVKIVRCTRGSVFDVVVDLRSDSPTFRKWFGIELNPDNASMLYVPEGCATGYLTLSDDTEIYYNTSAMYAPDSATGIRYDDVAFGIEWPGEVTVLSDNDKDWPDFII
jgi:dTDP-4-dehydrorhamnose 3,5-epimerase